MLQTPAPLHTALLVLDDRSEASVTGDPVVLIGYPTGIEGIFARAGSDVTRKVTENARGVTQIVSQLAAQHLIRPTTTQGHIGDILKDKIVYDAATTSGGSGGPLFNRNGKVIGVELRHSGMILAARTWQFPSVMRMNWEVSIYCPRP